jgi:hypothetical protein
MFELLAQHVHHGGGDGAEALLALISYLWFSFCLYTIAKRTDTEGAFFAFIPLLNIVLMLWIADYSLWWLLSALFPPVFLVVMTLVYMEICRRRGKASLLGLLFWIPIVHAVVLGWVAFSGD